MGMEANQTTGQRQDLACAHCGTACPDDSIRIGSSLFCCAGCRTVYELLHENGLGRFYAIESTPGSRIGDGRHADAFAYLDSDAIRRQIVDFCDGRTTRVTFQVPTIHCAACVWLLENLFRLKPGIGRSQVDFPKRTVSLSFDTTALKLSEVVGLLASLGYEPTIRLNDADRAPVDRSARRLHIQLGVAGFAFGNVMMLSFPHYLGLDAESEASLLRIFGWISLVFSIPVVLVSAADYWRSAWTCIRQRVLTIELPIAVGLAALFIQSAVSVVRGEGPGYLDSLTGLVFFLLCSRWFQRRTHDRLAFDRDYTSYFPLGVVRCDGNLERSVPLTEVRVGDRILVRNQELVPADAILIRGDGLIDYSFVTGEAEPVARKTGDYLYAGGRQTGGVIEVDVVKDVSQSYLTSLWNNDAFRKSDAATLRNLTNTAGRWFTWAILVIALGTVAFWLWYDAARAGRVFAAVLLVACPCALALSAPFALGSAMRILGRRGFFLRDGSVLERMAQLDTIVFDKTGTLTVPCAGRVAFAGEPLTAEEQRLIAATARASTHPNSRRIVEHFGCASLPDLDAFIEQAGAGIEGRVDHRAVRLGSAAWCGAAPATSEAQAVHVAIDGHPRGLFLIEPLYRGDLAGVAGRLAERFRLALLSGDNSRERANLRVTLGPNADLRFEQSPHDKLRYVRILQARGARVLMVGDGLNDAGALKQSDVGIAVTEDTAAFSPACDAIMDATVLDGLDRILAFARATRRVILGSFAISLCYNAIGVGLAASGVLSPLLAAILMPASSFSVIGFTLGATAIASRRLGRMRG
jgi:Cu+-exporting ATPase